MYGLQVDENVTRHLSAELAAKDWDILILHYLGLDHIGHAHGARSPLLGDKLLEMDNVIQKIFTGLKEVCFSLQSSDFNLTSSNRPSLSFIRKQGDILQC